MDKHIFFTLWMLRINDVNSSSNQTRLHHMVITMGFYTLSHGKFHDRGYFDILYGINSIDVLQGPIS